MKKLFLCFAMLVLLASCSGLKHASKASNYDFDKYKGKTVSAVNYLKDGAKDGDVLTIQFNDGTALKIYAKEYGMKILK